MADDILKQATEQARELLNDTMRQAAKRAREVLPDPVAEWVENLLLLVAQGFADDANTVYSSVATGLAPALLALPVPAPAVDREVIVQEIFAADAETEQRLRPIYPSDRAYVRAIADALISAGLVRGAVTAEHLSEITRRFHDDAYVSNQDDITRWYAQQFGIAVADGEGGGA